MLKNIRTLAVLFSLVIISLSSCRYGEQEAADGLKRNQDYKTQKASEAPPAINPDYVKPADSTQAQPAPTAN